MVVHVRNFIEVNEINRPTWKENQKKYSAGRNSKNLTEPTIDRDSQNRKITLKCSEFLLILVQSSLFIAREQIDFSSPENNVSRRLFSQMLRLYCLWLNNRYYGNRLFPLPKQNRIKLNWGFFCNYKGFYW